MTDNAVAIAAAVASASMPALARAAPDAAKIASIRAAVDKCFADQSNSDAKEGDESFMQAIKLSQHERKEMVGDSVVASLPFLYGEFTYEAIDNILHLLDERLTATQAHSPITIYDLGSGSGKTLLYLAHRLPLSRKCVGIELLKGLHDMASGALARLGTESHNDNNIQPSGSDSELLPHAPIEFVQGDFLQVDWSNADVVFVCATAFDQPLLDKLTARAVSKLKVGTLIVSVSHSFKTVNNMFTVLHSPTLRMSWGSSTVFIVRKRHNERLANSLLKGFGKR